MTRPWLWLLPALLTMCACVRVSHARVVVPDTGSSEGQQRLAEAMSGERELTRLRVEVTRRLPGTAESDLDALHLSVQRTNITSFAGRGSRSSLAIVVSARTFTGANIGDVVRSAAQVLREDMDVAAVPEPGRVRGSVK
jgi:hypothetical protein